MDPKTKLPPEEEARHWAYRNDPERFKQGNVQDRMNPRHPSKLKPEDWTDPKRYGPKATK